MNTVNAKQGTVYLNHQNVEGNSNGQGVGRTSTVQSNSMPSQTQTQPQVQLNPATLLERKLLQPNLPLTFEESLAILNHCIDLGGKEVSKVGDNMIVCIGNTGSGKSTLVNYLSGCTMQRKDPKDLGIQALDEIVVVQSVVNGGRLDEVMPIGHEKQSKTFMPQVANPMHNRQFCDCPGFLDNRGFEVNVANAINIKNALIRSKRLKIIILINYHSLKADRARGLSDMVEICCDLFGSQENLIRHKDSILLGVTQIPTHARRRAQRPLKELKEWIGSEDGLNEFKKATVKHLSESLFIYDPLDEDLQYDGAWNRETILCSLDNLDPIQEPKGIFKTVLTPTDIQGMMGICDEIKSRIDAVFRKESPSVEDFKIISGYQQSLKKLEVIEHPRVLNLIGEVRLAVIHRFQRMVQTFQESCIETNDALLAQSDQILAEIKARIQHFDQEVNGAIPIPGLEQQLAKMKKKQEMRKKTEEAHRAVDAIGVMERNFRTFCQNTNFVEAKKILKTLRQDIKKFSEDYSDTEVKLRTKIEELDSVYQVAKTKEQQRNEEFQKMAIELQKVKKGQEAQRAQFEIGQKEQHFKTLCSNYNFSQASSLLSEIQSKIRDFYQNYRDTDIVLVTDTAELERLLRDAETEMENAKNNRDKITQLEKSFRASCKSGSVATAESQLDLIRSELTRFEANYRKTGIRVQIDLNDLETLFENCKGTRLTLASALRDEIVGLEIELRKNCEYLKSKKAEGEPHGRIAALGFAWENLKSIKSKVGEFQGNYGNTGIVLTVNIAELERLYNEAKEPALAVRRENQPRRTQHRHHQQPVQVPPSDESSCALM